MQHIGRCCFEGLTLQPSSAMVDLYSFQDGPVDMQILALWTRSKCRVSDAQVIVITPGPLLVFYAVCLLYNNGQYFLKLTSFDIFIEDENDN